MKLQNKLNVSFLFFALLPLALVALLGYTNMRESLLAEEQRSLEAIAELKIGAIRDYFFGLRHDVDAAKEFFVVKTDLPVIFRLKDRTESFEYQQARKELDAQMINLLKTRDEFEAVLFANSKGTIIYSTNSHLENKLVDEVFSTWGTDAFEKGLLETHISDIDYDPYHKKFDFLISAPIYGFDKAFVGVLMVEMHAGGLNKIIQNTMGMGETGESLVARRVAGSVEDVRNPPHFDAAGDRALYLNPLRSDPHAALARTARIGDTLALPIQEAVQGKEGFGFSVDYRGKEVFAVWRYLPERNWGFVAKIDLDELLLPARVVAKATMVFCVVAFLAVFLIAWVLSRAISYQILELSKIAKKIGQGDLNVKFNEELLSAGGEVGFLAKTFAAMAVKLRDLYQGMEGEVKARTAELGEKLKIIEKNNSDLENINKLMIGRELKMVELKEEITKLSHRSGKKQIKP